MVPPILGGEVAGHYLKLLPTLSYPALLRYDTTLCGKPFSKAPYSVRLAHYRHATLTETKTPSWCTIQ